MDRRDTIKSLLLGSVAAGLALNGCSPNTTIESSADIKKVPLYGRTKEEVIRDAAIANATYFNEHELETISILCDIILPQNPNFGTTNDDALKDFIEFIAKDMTIHQIPIRGGLMWLDSYSNKLYDKEFIGCSEKEQFYICDQIAYPKKTKPALKQGEYFFTRMRNLTITGYFTSEIGIKELGYKGNTPNVWDGIPEEILKDYSVQYEDEWLAKCIDQSKRGEIAVWDNEGNLIS